MRVVLFDSDKALIDLLQERCRKCAVTLDVFADVEQAFAAVKENPDSVDVALISREMPAGDEAGFSLTKMLRADARTLEVPFIILSSKLKNTDFALHQKSDDGANAYLKKPATLQQILSTIEAVTGLKFPAEKKAVVKKPPPKAPVPGLNITLVEASKVLRLMEKVPNQVPGGQLVFFPDEAPAEGIEAEALAPEEVPVGEEVVAAAVAAAETAPAEPLPIESVLGDAPPSAVSPVPLEAPVAAVEAASPASGPLEISLALEVAPVAAEVPFEISMVSAEAPAPPTPVVDEIDPNTPASFDAGATAAPPPPLPAVSAEAELDQQAAQDLPYLFGGTTSTTKGNAPSVSAPTMPNAADIAAAAVAAVSAAGVDMSQISDSGDVETLKKYLMMREQDIAILSAQMGYAKEELGKAEQSIKSLNMQVEDFVHQLDDRNQRIETLEKELMHAGKSKESEIEQLRFETKSKIDRIKFLEDQLSTSAIQYEKLRDRVRQDIRKIRVREKELENKLEILKKDSETLIAARESKILELKRKIDLLEFNYDTLQDQNEAEKANVAQTHEKIAKVVKVLKLAMGIIEGETDNSGKPLDESDLKVA